MAATVAVRQPPPDVRHRVVYGHRAKDAKRRQDQARPGPHRVALAPPGESLALVGGEGGEGITSIPARAPI